MDIHGESIMMKKNYRVRIASTGIYIPEGIMDNEAMIKRVRANTDEAEFLTSEWIVERVGIHTRRRCLPHETLVYTNTVAMESALQKANWKAADLDFIILASISTWLEEGGMAIPSTACLIQENVGAYNAFAFDMLAACSGFIYGMAQGISFIESGLCTRGAVLCSENHDRGLNYADPKSCILIGDVSTVTLLEKSDEPNVHDMILQANDEKKLSRIIELPFGGYFGLHGKQVYKEGVRTMIDITREIITRNGYIIADINWFIFHQANLLMLERVGESLGIPEGHNLMNIVDLANTTAGTIPSVLAQNIDNGTIKRGDKIVFTAFGGGLTSGSLLMTY
jgi:3-oxoacyl-[acyl-carrier-protein] synthase-3